MARHSGKNLKVSVGGNFIDGCRSFNFDESAANADLTAAGDGWEDHDPTQNSWSGTIDMVLDHDAAANQTLRAGDVIAVAGYTEGDASGKTYLNGTASVESHSPGASYNGEATRQYSLKGKGALSITTVA